jgi:Tfp pilus assembly protein PilP
MKRNIIILMIAGTPVLAAGPGAPLDKPPEKGTIYSPVGKRDPFRPPALANFGRDVSAVNPLEKFAVEQLQLRAVLRGIGKAKAMFEDPEGKTHIITEGDVIGRERATVSRILNNEVIVTERTFNYLGVESLYEKVLSLPADNDAGKVETGKAPIRAPDNNNNPNRPPQNPPPANAPAPKGNVF